MLSNLHPESQAHVEKLNKAQSSAPPIDSVEDLRNMLARGIEVDCNFTGSRFELFLPNLDESYNIPVYVYRPSHYEASSSNNYPILVFFHGGAMVAGTRLTCDVSCKQLCELCQIIIVSIEYRRYPEASLLTPFDDGVAAVEWVKKHKQLIGGGPKSKVGVGGESAGGKIAASVAHDVNDLSFQILIYPQLSDGTNNLPSYEEFRDGPVLTLAISKWLDQYGVNSSHPRCASLRRSIFDHLPPVLFIVSEIDFLRDESYEYAKKLDESKVIYEFLLMKGVVHGFYIKPNDFKENCKIAFNATHEFIRKYGSQA